MLYRVFIVQWYFSTKGDWTLLVKQDLADFEIEEDLNKLSLISVDAFKKKIKQKAKIFAFKCLSHKKEMYKKLEHLDYDELNIQEYLVDKNFSFEEKITLFKYRTRMACYEENFRAGGDKFASRCLLCKAHPDWQFFFVKCSLFMKKLENTLEINHLQQVDDVYSKQICRNSVNILKLAEETRTALKKC